MSLTDFCNRSTTRAPTEPLDSPPAAPRGALGAGGDPVDAVLQLRSRSRRSPDGSSRRGAPDSGPALRRGRPVQPPSTLGARPLTPPVTVRATPRKAGPPGQPRTASAAPSSKGTASATRSAFHRRSPPRRPLAQVAGEPPSTSAITTVPEHDQRTARDPARLAGGCPPAPRCLRATTRLAARSGSSNPGPGAGGGLSARQRLPGDSSPGSFAPDPTCPDTSCHAPAPTPAGVARRRTTGPPAGSAGAPPASGLLVPAPPRRGTRAAHPRCLPSRGIPKEAPGFPQIVTSLWIPGGCAFWPSRSPRIDVREVPPWLDPGR